MHLMKSADMAAMMLTDWPMAEGLVIISGIALLLGGIGIISGKLGKWAAFGVALLMLIFIISLHMPNIMSDNEMLMRMGMSSMLKDSMVMGGALMIAWYFDQRESNNV